MSQFAALSWIFEPGLYEELARRHDQPAAALSEAIGDR